MRLMISFAILGCLVFNVLCFAQDLSLADLEHKACGPSNLKNEAAQRCHKSFETYKIQVNHARVADHDSILVGRNDLRELEIQACGPDNLKEMKALKCHEGFIALLKNAAPARANSPSPSSTQVPAEAVGAK